MEKTKQMIAKFWKDEEGATMLEYGVMVAFIAALSIATVGLIGPYVNNAFQTVLNELQ